MMPTRKARSLTLTLLEQGQLTRVDYVLVSIYPLTLFLGFCFSLGHSDNYFAHRRNIFNLLFVKNGWFWTTLVFFAHQIQLKTTLTQKRQAITRWALATFIWILVTQWAFGAPLTDRTMIWTGGVCEAAARNADNADGLTEQVAILTNEACKKINGKWKGGHDLSGHVFLLTHASLFLWYEVLPLLLGEDVLLSSKTSYAIFATITGWWWMLLMTAAFFHTWKEKLTGLSIALLGWAVLYKLLPRSALCRTFIGYAAI